MRSARLTTATAILFFVVARAATSQQGKEQDSATRVTDSVYAVFGGSNAYIVKTPGGNVLIDTCNPIDAPECLRLSRLHCHLPKLDFAQGR